jgi:hypothetical protein
MPLMTASISSGSSAPRSSSHTPHAWLHGGTKRCERLGR